MERIFYKSDCYDQATNLPIYVFDTSYLPSTEVINYDALIPALMNFLPDYPYVLIMFSCGLNKISWIWGIKFLKKFLADNNNNNLNNLVKIITVHDSWFVKSITQILTNFNITRKNFAQLNKLLDSFSISNLGDSVSQNKKKDAIINCSTLSGLNEYVDITKLKISLNVCKHNSQLENELKLSVLFSPLINKNTKINQRTDPIFYHHFYQIFNIINSYGDKVELMFHKPGNKLNTDIFFRCINRNQLIWINDWDLYCISTAFKKILMELSKPLISIEHISLPIKDDYKYTSNTFQKILKSFDEDSHYAEVLFQLCTLCNRIINHSDITKHSSLTLSKCLSHCLSHELISSQNKDHILIINRFFRNILDNWPQISSIHYKKFRSIDEIINGKEINNQKPDDSYDLSYDLIIEGYDEDEDYRITFNTTNILNNHSKLSNTITPISSPIRIPPTPKSMTSVHSTSPAKSKYSPISKHKEKSSDVSDISIQYPPQKYKFTQESVKNVSCSRSTTTIQVAPTKNGEPANVIVKTPLIRGRKVSELAKLYEERIQGIELLKGM